MLIGSILYYIVLLIFTLVYFVSFCLVFLLTAPFDRERAVLHWASRIWARGFYWLNPLWRMRVSGMENVEKGKAYVVIVNHQAMLDIPLMYVLPFNFKWVSKREVYKIPIFGLVLRMHGDIAIERGISSSTRKLMAQSAERLNCGTSVIIFPEGTRSKDLKVHKFKEGAFAMAKNAGVAILPCVADGTGSVLKGWKFRMPHTFTVKVLPPVSAERVAAADVKELAARTQELISAEYEKIRGASKN